MNPVLFLISDVAADLFPAPVWHGSTATCTFKNWDGTVARGTDFCYNDFASCAPLDLQPAHTGKCELSIFVPKGVNAKPVLGYDQSGKSSYCFLQCYYNSDCPSGQQCGIMQYWNKYGHVI